MIATIAAGVAALSSTLLRGFQNKAVAAGNKSHAFVVGGAMSVCDMLVIASVAKTQTPVIIGVAAFGAACGWLMGMTIHDRLTRKQREAAEKMARKAQKQTVKRLIEKHLSKEREHDRDRSATTSVLS